MGTTTTSQIPASCSLARRVVAIVDLSEPGTPAKAIKIRCCGGELSRSDSMRSCSTADTSARLPHSSIVYGEIPASDKKKIPGLCKSERLGKSRALISAAGFPMRTGHTGRCKRRSNAPEDIRPEHRRPTAGHGPPRSRTIRRHATCPQVASRPRSRLA